MGLDADPIAEAIARLRTSKDPHDRALTAIRLGNEGDARAFEPLEHAALFDSGNWEEDGGFSARNEYVSEYALSAVAKLAQRVEPTIADRERRRDRLIQSAGLGRSLGRLFRAFGPSARAILDEAATHADAAVRARAITIRDGLAAAVAHADEAVRLAAMRGDPDGLSLYHEAMRRFPAEPSALVRRAIFDVWQRVASWNTTIDAFDAMKFLADTDEDIRKRIARMILDAEYVRPSNDGAPLRDLAREVLAIRPEPPKPMHPLRALLLQRRAQNAKDLADAIREAEASGKEGFDWDRFVRSGCKTLTEEEQRFDYYVMKSEIRTMAEYIAHRKAMDPWEDCR